MGTAMTFDHCTTFEQLAKEGPIELHGLRKFAGDDLRFAKRMAEARMRCATIEEAIREAGESNESHNAQALLHFATQASTCTGCGLSDTRTKTVFSRGDGLSGLLVVGEAPGADEDASGVPFIGKSGQSLDKMLLDVGIDPAKVYVCNVVKCRPPKNRVPAVAEIAACSGFLLRQIQLVKPRVIVTLGATAGRAVLGAEKWPGMVAIRGQWQRGLEADVMPTFHPAYLFRVPKAKVEALEDMKAVAAKLGQLR